MKHPSREAITAFVMGIPTADDASLRRHLEHCRECARVLEDEARLEETLHAAAPAEVRVRAIRVPHAVYRSRRLRVAAAVALAALAVWAAAAWRAERARTPTPVPAAQRAEEGVPVATRERDVPTRNVLMRRAPGNLVVTPADMCRNPRDTRPHGPPW